MTPTQLTESLGMYQYGGGGYHCVHMEDADFEIFKKRGLTAVTNPASNLKLASGICPTKRFVDEGIAMAIGTDGPASNNCLDMFREMFLTSALAKVREMDAECVGADEILYMATAGGTAALGRKDIGHLAPGMAADFTLMNWNQLQYAGGCNDPVDCIVLSGDARMIETVVVNGETVVQNGRLTRVNEEEKRDYAAAVGRELLTKASTRIPGLKADLV